MFSICHRNNLLIIHCSRRTRSIRIHHRYLKETMFEECIYFFLNASIKHRLKVYLLFLEKKTRTTRSSSSSTDREKKHEKKYRNDLSKRERKTKNRNSSFRGIVQSFLPEPFLIGIIRFTHSHINLLIILC